MYSKSIARHIVLQGASLYKTSMIGKLNIRQIPVQQQNGAIDCGLYAIAYATELCHGRTPRNARFHQEGMRQHLHRCLSQGVIESFPMVSQGGASNIYQILPKRSKVYSFKLYCFCSMPESYDNMVKCTGCKEWIHYACGGISDEDDIPKYWQCFRCRGLGRKIAGIPLEFKTKFPAKKHASKE